MSVAPVYPATSLAGDSNRVTSFAHFHDSTAGGGWIQRQVAHGAPGGGGSSGAVQVTDSVYGVEKATTVSLPTDSLIASADWLREVRYSSASSGLTLGPSDTGYEKNRVYYGYNALGELRGVVDQNVTTHEYSRDALGRVLSDQVTFNPSPASGAPVVDQRVGAITAAYDAFGRLADVKSLGATSGTPVVDHVQYSYDRLDRITSVEQDPDSAIGATAYQHAPRTVAYTYETAKFSTSGSIGNRSRLSTLNYPIIPLASTPSPGQTSLHYTRGEPSGLGAGFASKNEAIGRVTGLWIDEWYGEEGTTLGAIAQYDYVGLSMIAHKDLAFADIALDRTVDSTGRRQYGAGTGAISTQDAAAYPGYDRFGRVKRQAWVAGDYDWDGSTTVPQPNRAEHYNSVSIYDRAGNPIRKWNAAKDAAYRPSWTDRDFEYHHDGLDRLTLARRGILIAPGAGMGGTVNLASSNPLAPEITNSLRARGSQKWGLDLLGNWQGFAIDLRTDGTDASPNATASGGGFETGEEQARSHDSINQLKGISLPTTPASVPAGAEFAAGPLFAPMSYDHDDAGSRVKASKLDSGGSPSTSPDGRFRFIYDAWNRLVQIDALTSVSGGTESWRKVSRYDFNGLHWRTRKLVFQPATEDYAEERVYTYNAAWQAIAEEIDDDRDTSSSGPGTPRIEHVVQQFFGLGGVNDAVYRRTANLPDGIGYNGTDTVDQTAFFGKCIYQLADSQGSIVAVVSACVMENKGEPLVGIGRTLEGLEYDPYGRSRHAGIAEFNHDGVLDSHDIDDYMTAFFAPNIAADQDQDGTVTTTDILVYLADWFAQPPTAMDELSDRWIDNPYGYCGYYADIETLGINGDHNGFLYHVRHREYDPIAGRWLQRDPAGFVDGMNLYGYYGVDPFGLSSCGGVGSLFGDLGRWVRGVFDNLGNWGAPVTHNQPTDLDNARKKIENIPDATSDQFVDAYGKGYQAGGGSNGERAFLGAMPTVAALAKFGIVAESIVLGLAQASEVGLTAAQIAAIRGEGNSLSVWRLGLNPRGLTIERMLGGNLPKNFPVIDKFVNGVVSSVKSIDLTAKTYQNMSKFSTTLRGYVDRLASFSGASRGGVDIAAGEIAGRELILAVPKGTMTAEQAAIIRQAMEYGSANGVTITVKAIE